MIPFISFSIAILITYIVIYMIKKSKKPKNFELEARKKLGISNYNELDYDQEVAEWLDTIIAEGLGSGIKKYNENTHYLNIEFNNGVRGYLWNSNKYYSWLNHGYIMIIDEETGEDVKIAFDDVQPTAFAMLKLKNAIDEFTDNICR